MQQRPTNAAPRRPAPQTPSQTPQRRPAPAKPSARPAQGAPQRRVGYIDAPQGPSLNRKPAIVTPLIALAAVLVVGILLQTVLIPDGWVMAEKPRAAEVVAEINSSRGVRLNEVMSANASACYDENGETGDWVEIYNASSGDVDITGWVLTDRASRAIRFTFPRRALRPGEYAIVFCDGVLKNGENDTYHAPFRLSALGDTLMLFDAHGTVVESTNVPPLGDNESYARDEKGAWRVTNEYTPLLENTTLNYALLTTTQVQPGGPLVLNEIMASNASYPSPSGGIYDWIEIYNRGSEAISLFGYGLSDNISKPSRWRFPDITLEPGQCLVVYCSGLDKALPGENHTSFRLAAEGEDVYLYAPSRQIIDAVSYENLKTDQTMARSGESWSVTNAPTPGKAN